MKCRVERQIGEIRANNCSKCRDRDADEVVCREHEQTRLHFMQGQGMDKVVISFDEGGMMFAN